MSWWGKIIGGTFGFAMGGPIGAILGASLGNYFDNGVTKAAGGAHLGGQSTERTQMAFFTALFSMMGYIAKADGRVSQDEIALTKQIMGQMRLDPRQRKLAMDLFAQGKQPGYPYKEVLEQFRRECHRSRNLVQMFLEILVATALADGKMAAAERQVLETIATALGFNKQMFEAVVQRLSGGSSFNNEHNSAQKLDAAYKILGVTTQTPMNEVKKAYRRLMSQHHPDKLVSKGLPEEMMQMATQKTQEIKSAYETIVASRE